MLQVLSGWLADSARTFLALGHWHMCAASTCKHDWQAAVLVQTVRLRLLQVLFGMLNVLDLHLTAGIAVAHCGLQLLQFLFKNLEALAMHFTTNTTAACCRCCLRSWTSFAWPSTPPPSPALSCCRCSLSER